MVTEGDEMETIVSEILGYRQMFCSAMPNGIVTTQSANTNNSLRSYKTLSSQTRA